MTDTPAPISEARRKWLWDEQHDLAGRAELSALYHRKRERFLSHSQKVSEAVTAVSATAAFSQLMAETWIAPWFALVAAVASIVPLTFGFSDRSRAHGQLAAEHRQLLADIQSSAVRLTEAQILAFRGRLGMLETKEPASLGALVVDCRNEIALAQKHPDKVVPLTRLQRLFMHFIDMEITLPKAPEKTPAN